MTDEPAVSASLPPDRADNADNRTDSSAVAAEALLAQRNIADTQEYALPGIAPRETQKFQGQDSRVRSSIIAFGHLTGPADDSSDRGEMNSEMSGNLCIAVLTGRPRRPNGVIAIRVGFRNHIKRLG